MGKNGQNIVLSKEQLKKILVFCRKLFCKWGKIFRHLNSCKRPLNSTFVIASFIIVHNTAIYPQSIIFTPKH